MVRKVVRLIIAFLLVTSFLIFFVISLESGTIKIAQAHTSVPSSVPTIATPLTSNISRGGIDWGNPTIIGALIALIGVFATSGVYVYQTRRNAKIEREKLEAQHQHEQELEKMRSQHEQALLRFQKELEEQYRLKERDLQLQEAAHTAMLQAKTLAERVEAYRKALFVDPRISRLQILDMNRPLALTDIFIRLRLHQETRPSYDLDPSLREAEHQRDPSALMRIIQLRLENRFSKALSREEALRNYRRCVILGDPGAGKTTLLKYLTLQVGDNRLKGWLDIPIHIELNAFANSGYHDLLEYASTLWEERYDFPKAEALSYMHMRLQEGNGLLLLDAIDETVAGTTKEQAEESYARTSVAITNLATRYHNSPIIVTARKAGYHQRVRLPGFTELEVLDFRFIDIKHFVERWFASHPDRQKRNNASELNAKLERNPRIQAIAANPLLLTLILIVYENQLDLPERRAELYKQCIDTLLARWDASRNVRRLRAFKPEHKLQLLEEVAWYFHLRGQRYFSENNLVDVIAKFLPAVGLKAEQNREVLAEIEVENGLLKEQARGWHGFLHLTLQEYFVAKYAVDHNQLSILLSKRDDPWWEEVLLLYAGSVPDASLLLQKLLADTQQKTLQDQVFQMNLILAGRCLAAYPTIREVALRDEIISRLFLVINNSTSLHTRSRAAEALAEIGGAKINEYLVQLLSDDRLDSSTRQRIVIAMCQFGGHLVIAQLVQLLSNLQIQAIVRLDLAITLSQWDNSVAKELVQMLSNKQLEVSIRAEIVRNLGRIGDYAVATELVQMLSNRNLEATLHFEIEKALRNWRNH